MHLLLSEKDRVERKKNCVQLLKDMFRLRRRGGGEECVYCGYLIGAVVKGVCAVVMLEG